MYKLLVQNSGGLWVTYSPANYKSKKAAKQAAKNLYKRISPPYFRKVYPKIIKNKQ